MKVTLSQIREADKEKFTRNGVVGILTRKYLACHITRLLAMFNCHPTTVTLFNTIIILTSVLYISTGVHKNLIIGSVLLFVTKILDSVDGQLARVTKKVSVKGGWVDGIIDRFKEALIVFAVCTALVKQTGDQTVWFIGFLALVGFYMLHVILQTSQNNNTDLKKTQQQFFLTKLITKIGIRPQFFALQSDTYLFVITILIAFNQLKYTLLFMVIAINVYWMVIFFASFFSKMGVNAKLFKKYENKGNMEKDYSFRAIKETAFARKIEQNQKGPYKTVMRYISIPFVKIALYLPISPNMMSLIGVLCNVLSFIPFTIGNMWAALVGVSLLYLGELSDYVDGPIARIKKIFSPVASHFFTHFYHQGSLSLVFLGIGIGVFNQTSQLFYIYAGIAATLGHLFTVYFLELRKSLLLEYQYEKYKHVHNNSSIFIEKRWQKFALSLFVFPLVHLRSILLFSILLNVLPLVILFYGLFLPLRAILFFTHSYLKIKKTE